MNRGPVRTFRFTAEPRGDVSARGSYSALETSEVLARYTDRFHCSTSSEALAMLREEGVAVLLGVVPGHDCDTYSAGLWRCLRRVTRCCARPLDITDPFSFDALRHVRLGGGPPLRFWGVPHSQEMWNIRQDVRVARVFADLHQCQLDSLRVNFGAPAVALPPEWTGYHFHNSAKDDYFFNTLSASEVSPSFEGHLVLTDVAVGDSTIAVVPKSHRYSGELLDTFVIDKQRKWKPFQVITPYLKWMEEEKGLTREYIRAPQGSMVLVDSRTAQGHFFATVTRQTPRIDMSVQVSMCPHDIMTLAQRNRQARAFHKRDCTSARASEPNSMTAQRNIALMMDMEDGADLQLSDFGKSLAGIQ